MFEDHTALVRSSPAKRESTLREIQQLGADTIRVEVKWNEVAPQPTSRQAADVRRHQPRHLRAPATTTT